MKINTDINRITNEDLHLHHSQSILDENFRRSVAYQPEPESVEPPRNSSASSILSPQESATLHMLFGAAKPQALSFYGKTKVQQIHKGHLIDILS
jgi:hypothetical protein